MASATETRSRSESGSLTKIRIDDTAFRAFQAQGDSDGPVPRIVPWFACWASGGRIDG